MVHELDDKLGDDGGISAVGILSSAKDIEVPEAYAFHSVRFRKDIGVEFIDIFRDGIRRERFSDHIFHLRQAFRVSVGRGTCSIDEAFHFGIPGGDKHVQKAADIDVIARDRIIDGAGHRTEGRLVQNIVLIFARLPTGIQIPDVPLDQGIVRIGEERCYVVAMAGSEVVQTGNDRSQL